MAEKKGKNFAIKFLILTLVFVFGFHFGRTQTIFSSPEDVDFSLLWETYYNLEKNFLGFEDVPKDAFVYGAVKGMVEALEDPYTVFLDPEKSESFLENIAGNFEGVGMEIGIREDELRVISPIKGTPAEEAGMRPGDVIIAVDGVSTKNMSLGEAVNEIRGPKGTSVVLSILRQGQDLDITIVRDVISIPSFSWDLIENDVAHVRLHHFHEGMTNEFSELVNSLIGSPAKGIILDLRNNPGGSLAVVRSITGWFLERDSVVVTSYEKGVKLEHKAKGNPVLAHYPMVVIINEGSASASEIMASALRDNRDVVIVGQTSFGKGSIQSLVRLVRGSLLKITVSEWFTPKGDAINEQGVVPDIEVEMTPEDFENEIDPQLEKAIEVLMEII